MNFPPHPLKDFEKQKYYQNENKFNGVYSRDNLPKTKLQNKVKDGAYVINLDEHADIGTNWVALYILNNKSPTLIVLESNTFQKKQKNLLKDLQL